MFMASNLLPLPYNFFKFSTSLGNATVMLPRRDNPWKGSHANISILLTSWAPEYYGEIVTKIFIIHCASTARIIIVSHVSLIASTSKIKTLGLSLVGGTITKCLYCHSLYIIYIYRGEKSEYSYILGSALEAWLHELIVPSAVSHKHVELGQMDGTCQK